MLCTERTANIAYACAAPDGGRLRQPVLFINGDWDAIRDINRSRLRKSMRHACQDLSLTNLPAGHWLPLDRKTELVARQVDQKLLEDIAIAYYQGRRLFVVTTNLDAQRAVLWNMGAIAASGYSAALDLFRKVLVASASVSGVFDPIFIDVTILSHRGFNVTGRLCVSCWISVVSMKLTKQIRHSSFVANFESVVNHYAP